MNKRLVSKALYWIPRVVAVIYTAFIFVTYIGAITLENGALGIIALMIPGTVIAIATAIAWNYPRAGAIILMGWSLLFFINLLAHKQTDALGLVVFVGVPLVIALAFLLEHYNPLHHRKAKHAEND